MTDPLVSVCIPTYQGAAFLGDTIDSVLNQSYPEFEIFILDDNSHDDTQAVVARYSDPRISYRRNAQNLGPEGNWNRCIELARGKYFKLLPHDDVLSPDCLAMQVAVLEQDETEEIALVFGSRAIIDAAGRVLMSRGLPRTRRGRLDGLSLIRRCIRAGTNLIGEPGNALFRRKLCPRVGAYDASHPYLVDLDYWCRILLHGDAYYLAEKTSSFRVSQEQWSVEIGGRQFEDFKGFVDKIHSAKEFRVSKTDRIVGLARARVNSFLRGIVYRHLFRGKQR